MRILLFVTVLCFVACGPTPYFSESFDIDPEGWRTENEVVFSPTITDTTATYELQLIIDHKTDYRYENIYFRIKTLFPDRPTQEENLTVDLATKKGKWVGKCSGENCKVKIYLLDNFKFPSIGKYSFDIRQYTRDEQLTGVSGLQLELYQKERD